MYILSINQYTKESKNDKDLFYGSIIIFKKIYTYVLIVDIHSVGKHHTRLHTWWHP